jgi:hypothetical protein
MADARRSGRRVLRDVEVRLLSPALLKELPMHDRELVAEALRLRDEEGLGARRVARRLGVSVSVARDWHAGKLPRHYSSTPDTRRSRVLVKRQHRHHLDLLHRLRQTRAPLDTIYVSRKADVARMDEFVGPKA